MCSRGDKGFSRSADLSSMRCTVTRRPDLPRPIKVVIFRPMQERIPKKVGFQGDWFSQSSGGALLLGAAGDALTFI